MTIETEVQNDVKVQEYLFQLNDTQKQNFNVHVKVEKNRTLFAFFVAKSNFKNHNKSSQENNFSCEFVYGGQKNVGSLYESQIHGVKKCIELVRKNMVEFKQNWIDTPNQKNEKMSSRNLIAKAAAKTISKIFDKETSKKAIIEKINYLDKQKHFYKSFDHFMHQYKLDDAFKDTPSMYLEIFEDFSTLLKDTCEDFDNAMNELDRTYHFVNNNSAAVDSYIKHLSYKEPANFRFAS